MGSYQNQSNRQSGHPRRRYSDGFRHVLLFYVLPFLIFNGILFYCVTAAPKLTIEVADTQDYLTTQIHIQITSLFPVKSLDVTLDGTPLELTQESKRSYIVTVNKNGSVEADITNVNGMFGQFFDHVNVLDDVPPSFDSPKFDDDILTLNITDSQSGVNFDSVRAVNADGQAIEPLVFDSSTGIVSYKVGSNGIQITALDKAGNETQRSYIIHKNGMAQSLESSEGPLHQIGENATETIDPSQTDETSDVTSEEESKAESSIESSIKSFTNSLLKKETTAAETEESSSEESSDDGLVLDLQ